MLTQPPVRPASHPKAPLWESAYTTAYMAAPETEEG
jgi:hypothetical protein